MTRRRLLCGLLLLSAVLACLGGWLVIASSHRVTRARFEQVKKGMSREEVIRTVGGPPGDYSNAVYPYDDLPRSFIGPNFYEWACDDGWLLVFFGDADNADMASDVVVSEPVRDLLRRPTLTERIRRWLGL